MISRLLNLRQYAGGPHFDRPFTLYFELEGTVLELMLPASDAKWQDPPRPLNSPFNASGWFEEHSERNNLNDFVHLHTQIWYYFHVRFSRIIRLMAMGTNEPMGSLSLSVQLNKLKDSRKLDLANPRSLGDYIKWEYDDYYESPERGDYGKGRNYEVRARENQMLARQGEWYRDRYEIALKSGLHPTPEHFDLRDFGGGLWTCFRLERPWHLSTQYYCIPLSESYYLQIDIQLLFHVTDKNRGILEPDMLSAAEWLVQHIKITFPGKPEGPLALPR
jgi:hypothetical protein